MLGAALWECCGRSATPTRAAGTRGERIPRRSWLEGVSVARWRSSSQPATTSMCGSSSLTLVLPRARSRPAVSISSRAAAPNRARIPCARAGRQAATRNPTASASSNDPISCETWIGASRSVPNTRAGIDTQISCVAAIATSAARVRATSRRCDAGPDRAEATASRLRGGCGTDRAGASRKLRVTVCALSRQRRHAAQPSRCVSSSCPSMPGLSSSRMAEIASRAAAQSTP